MTLFELVKIALDELYDEATGEYGAKTDVEIKKQLNYLSSSYSSLHEAGSPAINYKSPTTRFAYVYMYVASHGDYISQTMERFRHAVGPLFSQKTTRISCIGGGPGSDIIAALKYLNTNDDEPVEKLICYLVDGEQAWADAWTEFSASVETKVRLTTNFQPLDVTKPDSWEHQKKFLQADIFTLSYFVSEVFRHDANGDVSAFFNKLFTEAKPGAVIIYIDNGHACFNEFFNEIIAGHSSWKTIESADNFRILPGFDEQASNLSTYTAKFGKSPKIQSYVSIRVLQKKAS